MLVSLGRYFPYLGAGVVMFENRAVSDQADRLFQVIRLDDKIPGHNFLAFGKRPVGELGALAAFEHSAGTADEALAFGEMAVLYEVFHPGPPFG